MWALGCVLYEMLTLKKVFDATVSNNYNDYNNNNNNYKLIMIKKIIM